MCDIYVELLCAVRFGLGCSCIFMHTYLQFFIFLIFNQSSLADFVQQILLSLGSNFTLNHTLSKPKPKLYVLIMVCQHNTNRSSNTLVSKVLEPNSRHTPTYATGVSEV